jgi:hypothetical protein
MTHARPIMIGRLARHWRAAMLTTLVLTAPAHANDADDIRSVFDRYRQAALAHDGATAAGLVTPGSLDYYQHLRDLALQAPRTEVEVLPMADRLLVFRLRHEFTAAELQPLSGADLVRTSIEEAWSGPKALLPIIITTVEVGADTAIATPTRAGEPVPIRLLFRPSESGWQLDLVELARGSDKALEEALRFRANRAKVDIDTATRWAIEDTSGHLVDKDLWLPIENKAS